MKLIPLGLTNVNWKQFAEMLQQTAGISPIHYLDKYGLSITDMTSFIAVLEEWKCPGIPPRAAMQQADDSLFHIYLSFFGIFKPDELHAIYISLANQHLYITTGRFIGPETTATISGVLFEWKMVLRDLDKKSAFYKAVLDWLPFLNLKEILT